MASAAPCMASGAEAAVAALEAQAKGREHERVGEAELAVACYEHAICGLQLASGGAEQPACLTEQIEVLRAVCQRLRASGK
jgi:hypothetical protein